MRRPTIRRSTVEHVAKKNDTVGEAEMINDEEKEKRDAEEAMTGTKVR